MYASQQLLRVHHEEWLRHAEARRLIKQAADDSRGSERAPRRRRRRLALPRGLGRAVRPA
jgi:hypothetical protein